MQLVMPDVLADIRELDAPVSVAAFGVGLLLWLLGWRGHRFWIVLIATISAGIWGLYAGPQWGTQRLPVGVLLALAAGVLALHMARILAFGAGGAAAVLFFHQEPLLTFLIGGLIGLLLFRVWMMVLTSAAGSLVMVYAGLCLASSLLKLDVVALADRRSAFLNGVLGVLTLLGVLLQYYQERKRKRPAAPKVKIVSVPPPSPPREESKQGWWFKLPFYRRAG
jgi:hypothetical protein